LIRQALALKPGPVPSRYARDPCKGVKDLVTQHDTWAIRLTQDTAGFQEGSGALESTSDSGYICAARAHHDLGGSSVQNLAGNHVGACDSDSKEKDRGRRSRACIVIPGDDPPQLQGSPHLDRLKSYGEVVLYADRPATAEEKVSRTQEATCLLNSRGAVQWPGEALRQLPNLKMITTCGIGTDAIDLVTAQELGIVVCNIPGRTAPIVAEHAFGLMFAVSKRAWFQTDQLKRGRWTRMDNITLRGKMLGLLGAGSIAAEMARLSTAVGMRVQAWTFHPSLERARRLGVQFAGLSKCCAPPTSSVSI
jgi:hypothetical protein